jgi:hypothetical protein
MLGRQFVDEARGDRALPLIVDAAVRGEAEDDALFRAREPDIGEAPLFLEPGLARFVERALL